MQAYNDRIFAKVYNNEWANYAIEMGQKLLNFYNSNHRNENPSKKLLDLGCGTGQLANIFLENGFNVTGIDLSSEMLKYASERNKAYVYSGSAKFFVADISCFELNESFDIVVSTYDSINHLDDENSLRKCFECVFPLIQQNGYFIFDINTRASLENWKWHSISILDRKDLMMVTRGIYNEKIEKAFYKWSGFINAENGYYERFEKSIIETAFDTATIKDMLIDIGWRKVYFTHTSDFSTPIDEPEKVDEENAVVVIAQK